MKIKLKNITHAFVKNVTNHFNHYDAIFLVGLALAFITPEPWAYFFAGVMGYGAVNAVVKNARADITLVVADKKNIERYE